MTDREYEACAFCGTSEYRNARLSSEPTEQYVDGAPRASVPEIVLCYDCAEDVSGYLAARTADTDTDGSGRSPFDRLARYLGGRDGTDASETRESPFGAADARVLMERLQANDDLVLDLGGGHGYGIRFVDGEWHHAVRPDPAPPTVRTRTRAEVRQAIEDAQRLLLKRFDPAAWERFEDSGDGVWSGDGDGSID